jgi:hypothetical protein
MRQTTAALFAAKSTVDGVSGGAAVKPQRSRLKPELPKDDKPGAGKPERKKSVVQRRAPSRGKYIDEYAQPAV